MSFNGNCCTRIIPEERSQAHRLKSIDKSNTHIGNLNRLMTKDHLST